MMKDNLDLDMQPDSQEGSDSTTIEINDSIIQHSKIDTDTSIRLSNDYWQRSEGERDARWAMFNALILANSILFSGSILLMTTTVGSTKQFPLKIAAFLTPIFGLLICWAWYSMNERRLAYALYWLFMARAVENNPNHPAQAINMAKGLAEEKRFRFLEDEKIFVEIEPLGRASEQEMSRFVIGLFGAMHLTLWILMILDAVKGLG